MTTQNYLPTYIPADRLCDLLSVSNRAPVMLVYLVLCDLGAGRERGWKGSLRQLVSAIEERTGKSINRRTSVRPAIATLCALGALELIENQRTTFMTFQIVKPWGGSIVPGINRPQSGDQSSPEGGINRPQSGDQSSPKRGSIVPKVGIIDPPSSDSEAPSPPSSSKEEEKEKESSSAQGSPFGAPAGSPEHEEEADPDPVDGQEALERVCQERPDLEEKLAALRTRMSLPTDVVSTSPEYQTEDELRARRDVLAQQRAQLEAEDATSKETATDA